MPRARAAAIRALELDPRSAEAHASFAFIRSAYDWEWAEAEALYRRAIELGPGYATAHHWLANDFLAVLGRLDEAADEIEIARQLDPLSLIIQEGRAYLFTLARRYDKAIETYQALIDLDPSFFKFYTSMGRAYMLKGMYADAIAMLEQGRALAGEVPSILGALGQTYAGAGDRAAAQRLLDELKGMASNRHVPATCFALVHAGLGEYEAALDWLERGCAQHELPLPAINVHPAYDALRDRPRFTALLRRMRFPS
jgi:serine/threonine-protein kinase